MDPTPPGYLADQLVRLERLLDLQREHKDELNQEGYRLLNHAVFTTFIECREYGGEEMALALISGRKVFAEVNG